ncbi:MAG: DNA alkylation repair protein [Myxococcota bacterium]
MNVEITLRELRANLSKEATPERAINEKKYLKSSLEFLGVNVPILRREAKAFVRVHPELDRASLERLSRKAWETEVHELRSLAIAILEQRVDLLRPSDAKWLITLLRSADTWAHVDWLAIKVLGPLVAREPALARSLDDWAKDKNFWIRRTALLCLHDVLLAGAGDFAHFARLAEPMLSEREFFIRKAIGWVLRATAKRNPQLTYDFVSRHAAEMSGVTFKEATRALPATWQKRLRTLRAAPG